jgi:hypothetical protein
MRRHPERRKERRRPGPGWFLIRHGLAGSVAGWTTVGGLLWLDLAGPGNLLTTSDLFSNPLLLLLALFGITFGSVAVAAPSWDWAQRRCRRDGAGLARTIRTPRKSGIPL